MQQLADPPPLILLGLHAIRVRRVGEHGGDPPAGELMEHRLQPLLRRRDRERQHQRRRIGALQRVQRSQQQPRTCGAARFASSTETNPEPIRLSFLSFNSYAIWAFPLVVLR